MEINNAQKKELKRILIGISDETDMKEMEVMNDTDLQDTLERNNRELKEALNKMANVYQNAFTDMQKGLLKGLESLKTTMEESAKAGKQADWSGFFKDMPTMLSQIGENTGKTSQLIQNLKWNASQQLRDVNGSPINPSIAAFGITATYDDVKLSNYDGSGNVGTVKYYQSGQQKAELSLTYDLSGNLTDVQRVS